MNDKKDSELIRGDQLQAFNLWDIPSFDEAPHQVSRDAAQPEVAEAEPVVEEVEELPEVKPFTVEELEQIRAEAYNEGFATGERDGFHSGQLKAQQEAKTRIEARLDELGALMAQLFEPLQQQDDQIEDMLLTLVESMVRQVIQRELQTDSSQIVLVLRGAVRPLQMGANKIRIYLHPADVEAVKRLRERHEEGWRLLEDDQQFPGGCRVETEHRQVDASRGTRLQQAIEQLYEQ